jgi:hypothetical protein
LEEAVLWGVSLVLGLEETEKEGRKGEGERKGECTIVLTPKETDNSSNAFAR